MTLSSLEVLEEKLASVKSIHDIQQILASEGVQMSDVDVAKGLIADGASTRFAHLSDSAQQQLAQVVVLAERDPGIAQALMAPDEVKERLPGLLAAHGLSLDAEALSALSQPLELDDQQLEQVVGGIDPVTAGLITLGITTLGGVLTLWIKEHYASKRQA
ncbi:MAG: hypothetical protein FJ070_07630 [Cyanobacteria bacterium K_DeepCast_150m_m2_101]|nr:hypothetical protein [Cyanobacteria bacterium K_DeepCast_150m_m2_101]